MIKSNVFLFVSVEASQVKYRFRSPRSCFIRFLGGSSIRLTVSHTFFGFLELSAFRRKVVFLDRMVFYCYSLQPGSFDGHWVQYDSSHGMYFVGFQDGFLLLWFLGPSSTAREGELISPFWLEHDRIYIDLPDYLIHLFYHQVREKRTQD